ncbi:FAD binding domain-containing protein, partial [Roridomyces roridus]
GPGGTFLAQALAKLGISVHIVDRSFTDEKYGNADGLMSRTLEIWQSYGLLEKIAAQACPVHVMVGYEQCEQGISRSVPCTNVVVPARYQYDFGVAPEIIEAVLRKALEETGNSVAPRLSPSHIDRDSGVDEYTKVGSVSLILLFSCFQVVLQRLPKSVQANGHDADPPNQSHFQTVAAKFVVGADGAHSWVRRNLKIPMEGDQTTKFGIVDVTVETNFPDWRTKCIIQAPTGAAIIIPREDDKIRIYVQFDPSEASRDMNGRLSIQPDVACNMVLERAKVGLRPYEIEYTKVFWSTVFTVSQMVAAKYSVDRKIFILGDACHTHSPKAGQGANAAIGDAHNLAWKLAHVLRGWAKPSLLDTYEIERRRYAQDLIAFDKDIADSLDGGTAADYQRLLHQQNLFTSGIGIRYESDLILASGLPKGAAVEAGYRLPPCRLERLADWRPQDLQDLAVSDGLFKMFVLPGDLLHEADAANRLELFCNKLSSSDWLGTRVCLYTILNGDKAKAMWNDVPLILRDWKRYVRCF